MVKTNNFFYYFRLFLGLFLLLNSSFAQAVFYKSLWPIWEVNNPLSTAVISHDDWQIFLNKRVLTNEEGINLIDYSKLTSEDDALLKGYIAKMEKIDIDAYNRDEQLAFWINLYNALTVHIIMVYYPVSSIEEINISPGLFSIGPWGAKLVTISGTPLSLDEIHNRIIRPIWNDPRTHYAINNGSIGAANLRKEAFDSRNLEPELNEAAADYINSFRGVQVIDEMLIVSKIYEWFNEDFGGTNLDIINHLKQFANPTLSTQLNTIKTIDGYTYNWHLNSTIPAET